MLLICILMYDEKKPTELILYYILLDTEHRYMCICGNIVIYLIFKIILFFG